MVERLVEPGNIGSDTPFNPLRLALRLGLPKVEPETTQSLWQASGSRCIGVHMSISLEALEAEVLKLPLGR